MVAVHIQLSFQGQLMPQFMSVLVRLYVLVCEVEELMAFESLESSQEIRLLGAGPHSLLIFS